MRNAFTESLCEIARQNEKVFLLVADIGNITFDLFRKDFPDRFLNVGVAEANMVGVAAGLALSGKIPFVYTIASFLTMRAFEQIRNDVCYQNLNVKIVGVGGGVAYSTLGPTHHALEDISMFRAVPNMTIVSPADPVEARKVSQVAVKTMGPMYIRLAKAGEPVLNTKPYDFRIGRAVTLREGNDTTFITTGAITKKALLAAESLSREGIQARVLNMHTLKPLDREVILRAAAETKAILTVEEHSLYGGLGSAVAEVLAEEASQKIPFKRMALPDLFSHDFGSQDYLTDTLGLSVNSMVTTMKKLLRLC